MQALMAASTQVRNPNCCERPRARLGMSPGPRRPNLAVWRARRAAGELADGPDDPPTVGPSILVVGLIKVTLHSYVAN